MSNHDDKLRVGVILGGVSSEREISLESGRNIYFNLDPFEYESVPIFLDTQGRFWEITLPLLVQNTTEDIAARLDEATLIPYEALKERIDFAYIGLHGKYGEDGCLQGLLELLGVPYTGAGVLGSALGMDKAMQRRILRAAGIEVPRHVVVCEQDWLARPDQVARCIEEEIGYPCVTKPTREGCSTGITVVRDVEQLAHGLTCAFEWDVNALAEELLQGMEITIGVIGNDDPVAFLPTQVPAKGDFLTVEEKFLPGEGEMITPAPLPAEMIRKVQEVAVRTYQILSLKAYCRIDAFVVGERVIVTEPNTLPGMTPSTAIFHGAAEAGLSPMALIDKVIQLSLEAHAEKKGPLA